MNVFLRFPVYDQLDKGLSAWWAWLNYLIGVSDGAKAPEVLGGVQFHSVEMHESRFGPDRARNEIVEQFLAEETATHLWMIDSDVVPPRNLELLEVAQQRNIPLIAGVYDGYNDEHGQQLGFPLVYKKVGEQAWRVVHRHEWPQDKVFKADAAGTGCMLISREVFSRTGPSPWFYLEQDAQGHRIGEDLLFCQDAGGCAVLQTYQCEHYRPMPLSVYRGMTDFKVGVELEKKAREENKFKVAMKKTVKKK